MKAAAFVAAVFYFVGGAWAVVHILVWHDHKTDRLLIELLTILGAGFLLGRATECLREFLVTVKPENPVEYHAKREYHEENLGRLAGEISAVMKAYREPDRPAQPIPLPDIAISRTPAPPPAASEVPPEPTAAAPLPTLEKPPEKPAT